MLTVRARLRQEISDRLIPELRRRGFDGPSTISGNALLHEFKRQQGGVIQVLSVQFEKHGLPRFVINVHIEPPEGYDHVYAHGGTIPSGRVTPRPGPFTRSWFRADQSVLNRLLGASSREVDAVSEAIAVMNEIEGWWSEPRSTEHIRDESFRSRGKQGAA